MKVSKSGAVLFLAAATQVETYAQYAQTTENAGWTAEPPKAPNTGSERTPFTDIRPPSHAGPGGDAQKEEDPQAPVTGGFWLLAGLALAYGFVCRKARKEE